jgi:NDP-sugar pyrophosphorylase family protein
MVNGVPILRNTLDRLAQAGIEETVLVVGYLRDLVHSEAGERIGPMRVSYRTNVNFETTNTTQSLWIGLAAPRHVTHDVLIVEGDVYFDQRAIDSFLASPHADATLVEEWHPALSGSVVQLAGDRTVRAWLHEKHRPPGFPLAGTHKTVNLHKFSDGFVREHLFPTLTRHVERGGTDPIEAAMATIVADGGQVHAVDVAGRWCEVDDERDLQAAEEIFGGTVHAAR